MECALFSGGVIFICKSFPALHCIPVTNLVLSFRTETVVEKLLTNWMSICLYAFVRVSSLSPCGVEGPGEGKATALLCALLVAEIVLESPSFQGGKCDGGPFAGDRDAQTSINTS